MSFFSVLGFVVIWFDRPKAVLCAAALLLRGTGIVPLPPFVICALGSLETAPAAASAAFLRLLISIASSSGVGELGLVVTADASHHCAANSQEDAADSTSRGSRIVIFEPTTTATRKTTADAESQAPVREA